MSCTAKPALSWHSCHSCSAWLSQTMPAPTCSRAWWLGRAGPVLAGPCSCRVRMGMDRQKSSVGAPLASALASAAGSAWAERSTQPNAPVYKPRGVGGLVRSSSSMYCMALRLGAPVMEPQGKLARSTCARPTPGRSWALMVLVMPSTRPLRCTSNSAGTCTLPVWAMRPRSLRSRSTIMMFSARLLASWLSRWAAACSCAGSSPAGAGAVPFMGCAWMRPPWQRRNSSGESDSTHCSGAWASSVAGRCSKAP